MPLIFHSRSDFPTLGVWVQEFGPLLVSMSKLQLVVHEQFRIWKSSIFNIALHSYKILWHVFNDRSVRWMSSLWHDIFSKRSGSFKHKAVYLLQDSTKKTLTRHYFLFCFLLWKYTICCASEIIYIYIYI